MSTLTREVQNALVALFTTALDGVADVYDGPRKRTGNPTQYLIVGVNGLDESGPAVRSTQGPSTMSGDWRDEAGEIDCTLVTWTGDPDGLDTIRATSDTTIGLCEAAVNADRRLGGLLQPANNFAHLTALDLREAQTSKGPFVEAVFTISYSTVLTS